MRHITYRLAALLLLAAITAMPAAAYDFIVDGIAYNITDKTAKIVEVTYTTQTSPTATLYSNYSGRIIIPPSVTYNQNTYSVSSIGEYAFWNCDNLTEVVIPSSVSTINDDAFTYCAGLKTITIPNSVCEIGNYALAGCTSLTNVTLPNAITKINEGVFAGSAIINVNIPNTVTVIGRRSFSGCYGLAYVDIPNSVTQIEDHAFSSCSSLTNVVIPNSVTFIDSYAFSYCSELVSVTIPSSVSSIGNAVFYECAKLKYVFCESATPPAIGGYVCPENTCIIVPRGSISLYENDEMWYDLWVNGICISEFAYDNLSWSTTQTVIDRKFRVYRLDGLTITDVGAEVIDGRIYKGSIIETTDDYYTVEVSMSGLETGKWYDFHLYVIHDGQKWVTFKHSIQTNPLEISLVSTTGPTSLVAEASVIAGSKKIAETYYMFNNKRYDGKTIRQTGLKPEQPYTLTYYVSSDYKYMKSFNFTTPALTMTTQPVRMLSNSSPMLIATTNIADEETSCGFEWRRYDAPDEMPSVAVYCPVYGGTMAGTIKNMSENVYYKYRPFYKTSDGTMYYGDWVAFITADAGVSFEPVVYTYKSPAVTQTGATLQGVALRGSDEITSQGFMYWLDGGARIAERRDAPASGAVTVTASGERMSATIDGLRPGTTYRFCSFVTAGGRTTYGDEVTFTTEGTQLKGDVNGDGSVNATDIGIVVNILAGLDNAANYDGRADVNADGAVNAADIAAVVNVIAGVE